MLAMLDSLGAILGVVITALLAALAVITKLWQGAKAREREAQHEAQQAQQTVGKVQRVHEADRAAEQAGAEREQEVVEQAKTGRRDHFETTK